MPTLTDEEIKLLIAYARRRFLQEPWPMSPSLQMVRKALGKIEPKPEALSAAKRAAMNTVEAQLGTRRTD